MSMNSIFKLLGLVCISICFIGIIISFIFQIKGRKKYKYVSKLISEKGNTKFEIKDCLSKEDIISIDPNVNLDHLMCDLYDTYILLEEKNKNLDDDLDFVLTGILKDYYINKIKNNKNKGLNDIVENIDLIGYSITSYSISKIKFRVSINCLSYKVMQNKIISGSNVQKVNQILDLEYEKVNDKWLISSYQKLYEKMGN